MRHILGVSTLCGLLVATPAGSAPGDKATALMKDHESGAIGTIALTETPQDVRLTGVLGQLPPGPHGFHAHAVGQCEPPFTSAGGHFNPESKKHGFHDASGSDPDDLPNRHAVADTIDAGLTVSGGSKGLLDQDGTVVVVHEGGRRQGRSGR